MIGAVCIAQQCPGSREAVNVKPFDEAESNSLSFRDFLRVRGSSLFCLCDPSSATEPSGGLREGREREGKHSLPVHSECVGTYLVPAHSQTRSL